MSRPYTERFTHVMGKLASAVGDNESAPKLLRGTGDDKVHLLVVMTAERGLCGGFNGNIAKLAKAEAQKLLQAGKTVKIITVGKKGRDAMKRDLSAHFIQHIDMTDVKNVGYADAQNVATTILDRFEAGEFDVAKIFYSKFQNVVTQIPTIQQVIPFEVPADAVDNDGADSFYDYEPDERRHSGSSCCRGLWPRPFSQACWKTAPRNRAHGCRQWTTPRATRVR